VHSGNSSNSRSVFSIRAFDHIIVALSIPFS
jgi:hypothetical protein